MLGEAFNLICVIYMSYLTRISQNRKCWLLYMLYRSIIASRRLKVEIINVSINLLKEVAVFYDKPM